MKITVQLVALVAVALLFSGATYTSAEAGESSQKAPAAAKSKQKGWLGVSIADASSGARVREVVEDSPAETAGLKEDDVIVEFNNTAVADANDLVKAVRKAAPGETVSVVVMREKQKKTLQVKVGSSPEHELAITVPRIPHVRKDIRIERMLGSSEPLGLRILTLNSQLGEYFGAPDGKGVLVERVKGKSAAAKAGFKAGDIIVKIGKEAIDETDDIFSAMDDYEEGDTITVQILRKGTPLTLAVMAPDRDESQNLFFRYNLHDLPEPDSHLMWFDKQKFHGDMERLKEEMRNLGQEIRTKMKEVQFKLQQELRQVGT
jgi:S1-C subfamily serine protease